MEEEAIKAQLLQFGYSQQEIADGARVAVNKTDINEVMECIESNKKQPDEVNAQVGCVHVLYNSPKHMHSLSVSGRAA